MPYIQEVVIAGATKEVHKKHSSRYGRKGIPRGENKNTTPEAMKRVNERHAETNLRRLINTNYKCGDIHLVLTYRKGERPTPEQARRDLELFLKRLRRYYKKKNEELKYISVTEYANAAIHHHLIINSMDTRDLIELWPHGQPRPTYLDNTGQYGQLASYLIKETSKTYKTENGSGKRWSASKNLKKPKIIKTIVKANSWREIPKATEGYCLEINSIDSDIDEVSGYPYLFYSMVKIQKRE